MLGLGWTEMLLIAALALIVVGPRDLPVMLRQLGRAFGIMRRMGNEFKSEFNKMAAIDEIRDVRKSLTDPLRNAQAEIQREFNKTTATGIKPSGALKPDAGEGESVVGAIKTQAGMNASSADEAMKAALAQSRVKVSDAPPAELAGETGKAAAKPKTAAKSARKPQSKAAGAKSATAKTAAAKTATAKTAAAKSETPAKGKTVAVKSAAKPRAASKSAADPKAAAKPAAPKSVPAKSAPAKSKPAKSTTSKVAAKPAEDKPAKAAAPKARAARKPAAAKAATAKPAAAAKTGTASGAKPAGGRTASKTEKA